MKEEINAIGKFAADNQLSELKQYSASTLKMLSVKYGVKTAEIADTKLCADMQDIAARIS